MKMRFVRLVAVVSALFAMGNSALVSEDWQSVIKTYGPAVGKIEIRRGTVVLGSGSGFIIDREGSILTNAHVVRPVMHDPEGSIVITFPYAGDPKEYPVRIVDVADDLDLAVLSCDARPATVCTLDPGPVPALGSEVMVIGYPFGEGFKATPGYLQAMQDMKGIGVMLDLSASVDFGNSGGPVFDRQGRVIGIVTAKIYGSNFNLALPSGNAVSLLNKATTRRLVHIDSNPSGARLFLNGVYRGVVPLDVEMFDRDYEIVLEKEGFETLRKTMKAPEGASPRLSLELVAAESSVLTVEIRTVPEGAVVSVNNTELGKSPVTLKADRGTKLRIRATLSGYRMTYREVRVSSEKDRQITIEMEK